MARDNFLKSVKDALARRVAYRCSNPDCRVSTIGPSNNGKTNNIGIAAHICAASKGGPRYKPSMNAEERKSIHNAIWLCSNCATEIDRDVVRYTEETLNKWKETTEAKALTELGRKQPSDTETIDTLTTALSVSIKDLPVQAVTNVHTAVERSFENLDSRFSVNTSYVDGKTHVGISAKEVVPLNFQIADITVEEFTDKYQLLLDHGDKLQINSEDVRISGSKLFEEITDQKEGVFTIFPNKLPAKHKFWFVNKRQSCHEVFDDIDGTIQGGTRSFSFNGSNCGGLFLFRYKYERENSDGKLQAEISLDLDQWEGKELSQLPYFEKIFSFFKKLSNEWNLFASLEVNGNVIMKSGEKSLAHSLNTKTLESLLYYTHRARIVAAALNLDIAFTSNLSLSVDELTTLAEVAEVAELFVAPIVTTTFDGNFSCVIKANKKSENIQNIVDIDTNTIKVELSENSKVKIFNQEVILPSRKVVLENVKPKIHGNLKLVKEGELVTIDWLPAKGFKMTTSFID